MTLEQYVAYLATFSVFTFILYVSDKKRAIKGAWRIRESLLLALSFFGGAYGGYLAMHIVRHKTRKPLFHVIHCLAIAWQTALLIYLIANR